MWPTRPFHESNLVAPDQSAPTEETAMPTINIPAKVRFILYLVGAIASLGVAYAVNKAWAGDAEVQLVAGLVALINVLAAAKTNLSSAETDAE